MIGTLLAALVGLVVVGAFLFALATGMLSRRPHKAIAFACAKPLRLRAQLRCRYVGVDSVKSAAAATTRQMFPVIAYTGANGSGKTAAAVYDLLPTLAGQRWECRNIGHAHTHRPGCRFRPDVLSGCDCELAQPIADVLRFGDADARDGVVGLLSKWAGDVPGTVEGERLVWSTTALLDGGTEGRLHPRYRPLRSLRDLVRCEHGEVLLDEVQGVADARDHQSMPVGFRKMVYELRRRDVICRWTAVDYSAADARMRQITQAVVAARGFDPEASDGGKWLPKRRFRWATYDAGEFDHFTVGARKEIRPLGVQHVWRPGHVLERSYDTLAPVLALTMASESGTCMTCGGGKTRPKCGCPDDETLLPPGVRTEVTARGTRVRVPLDVPEQPAAAPPAAKRGRAAAARSAARALSAG